ncbi:MAG: transporter substrate-binding domain-containing protein [Spirochaetales bacterium]|nr:transporter substrate-binding domain-containing protein [Spirochaetales bacterium]
MKNIRRGVTVILLFFCALTASGDEVFTISTSYNNLLSNPEHTGMLDRIMTEVFRRINVPMELVYTETDKSVFDVNAGILDGEINRIAGFDKLYPNLVQVPEPNMIMRFVAFARKKIIVDGWESIKDLYIGHVGGWKIIEDNVKSFPHVISTPTEKELFRMLADNRIDVALYSLLTGLSVIKTMQLEDIIALDPPLESRNMYLYVHKKHRQLVEKIAKTLREMKADGSYDRIVSDFNGL